MSLEFKLIHMDLANDIYKQPQKFNLHKLDILMKFKIEEFSVVSTSIFDSYNFKEYQLFYYVCIAYMLSYSVVSDSLQTHDCSSPGSSVHEIFQARILVWVANSSSRGSS